MKSTVTYTIGEPDYADSVAYNLWATHAERLRALVLYLYKRGITVYCVTGWQGQELSAASFTVVYKSPQHRTATELMMSGCSVYSTLTSKEVI